MRSLSFGVIATCVSWSAVLQAADYETMMVHEGVHQPYVSHCGQPQGCGWTPCCVEPVPHKAMMLWQSHCQPKCAAPAPCHVQTPCPAAAPCHVEAPCDVQMTCPVDTPCHSTPCHPPVVHEPCHSGMAWPSMFRGLFHKYRHGIHCHDSGTCGSSACENSACDQLAMPGVDQLSEPGYQSWQGPAAESQDVSVPGMPTEAQKASDDDDAPPVPPMELEPTNEPMPAPQPEATEPQPEAILDFLCRH